MRPGTTPSLYDTPRWRRLAARHLQQHPICAVAGCGKAAQHADHIRPVRDFPHLAFDPANIQSLCTSHHSIVTPAYDLGSIRGACDAEGNTVDPDHPWAQADNTEAIAAVNRKRKADPNLAARLKLDAVHGIPPRALGASRRRI